MDIFGTTTALFSGERIAYRYLYTGRCCAWPLHRHQDAKHLKKD